ncbi:hypothetical protein ACFE04_003292 [Oxalis oulophora]
MGFYRNELYGLKYILMCCPFVETLIFDVTPPNIFEVEMHYVDYWANNVEVGLECVVNTLKLVGIRMFTGTNDQLETLRYLLSFGRNLKALKIYLPKDGVDEVEKETYLKQAEIVLKMKTSSTELIRSIHY